MATKTARAKKSSKTLAVVELGNDDQEVETEEDATRGIPLFEGLTEEVRIDVYRMEPVEEGNLGTLAPDADEATIARRWGGGVYRVTAKGTDGRFGRKQRTVTISGDPKLSSKEAIRKYRIMMGEIPDDASAAKPAAPAAPALDVPGLLSILQSSHQQSMQFMQAQVAAAAAISEQRRQADAQVAEQSRQRDREFFATMLQLQKTEQKNADPLAMVPLMVKFLELGKNMASGGGGGEGAGDPVTAFIQALPVILPQAQAMLSGGQAAAAPPAAPANQQAAPEQAQGPRMVVTGDIALQLDATFKALQAKGYDAEKAMTIALAQLAQVPNAPTKPEPPAPPPADEEPPKQAAAGGNGTSPAPRATRKK